MRSTRGDAVAAAAAADRYGGQLLPDDRYESWAEAARDRLQLLHLRLLRQAGRWAEPARDRPTDAEAHLALMREHAARGDRRAALRQFERMERALHGELGVGPSEEAVALRDSLLDGPGPGHPRRPDAGGAGRVTDADIAAGAGRGRPGSRPDRVLSPVRPRAWASPPWPRGCAARPRVRLADRPGGGVGDRGCLALRAGARGDRGPVPPASHPARRAGRPVPARHRPGAGRRDPRLGPAWRPPAAVRRGGRADPAGRGRPGAPAHVDDVQDADEASLRLVHYLARSCLAERLVLVLCHRRQPVTDAFEQVRASLLGRDAAVEVSLAPLDRGRLRDAGPGLPARTRTRVLEQIWAVSGGVPFAVVELARGRGVRCRHPSAWPVVLDMLAPAASAAALEPVAITGSTFDTDEFLSLSGLAEEEAYDCLDAALAALVIERPRRIPVPPSAHPRGAACGNPAAPAARAAPGLCRAPASRSTPRRPASATICSRPATPRCRAARPARRRDRGGGRAPTGTLCPLWTPSVTS